VALYGLRIARKRDRAALSRLVHVIVPARVLAWLLSHPKGATPAAGATDHHHEAMWGFFAIVLLVIVLAFAR